jgi:CheY-like chemotaxis protein
MDTATQARLFRRFVQGDGEPARRHGGSGLGLEISRNLARLMGGDISVRSQPGQGSTFVFRMPLQAVAAEPMPAGTQSAQPSAPAQPLRVLVAEDHPVNREYMAALLDSLGHHAHFAADGQEAVRAASEQPFDLVLMDLHMPVLDGVAATRAIRALPDPKAATLPIVGLTADAYAQTRERCLVAGMNDFLTKPVSPRKLSTSLRQLFGSAVAEPATDPARGSGKEPVALAPRPAAFIDPAAIESALQAMSRQRLAELIHDYLDGLPRTVQRLRAALRDAQPLDLQVHAHAARGAALNLGLCGLAATAEALQDGAAQLPAHEVARLVQRFEEFGPLTRDAAMAAGLAKDSLATPG